VKQIEARMPEPRISVVIPAYNEERYLGATLESVHAAIEVYHQRYGYPVEVVVVNNNSSDCTEGVARGHGARVVFEAYNQISTARNTGAKAARGEILAFLDADDHMSPDFLVRIEETMASGAYIGGGASIRWDKQSGWVTLFNRLGNCLRQLLGVSNALPFARRDAYEKVGGFDERYYAGEDMKFAADLKKLGKQMGKRFRVVTDGYVLKSARKFDRYGGMVVLLGFVLFLINPWLVRSKRACFFWYSDKK
jgi:glycosyltransferase involved in cell wall biosynthesis